MKIKYLTIGIISIAITVSLLIVGVKQMALGSQIARNSTCKTSSATSSPDVLASSTNTTSVLICDAYHTDTYVYDGEAMNSATLAVQFTAASTTSSTLTIALSYSSDGIDWYQNYLTSDEAMATTTTTLVNSATTTKNYIFSVKTPTRYVKATFGNTGTATTSVWAEFVPLKK